MYTLSAFLVFYIVVAAHEPIPVDPVQSLAIDTLSTLQYDVVYVPVESVVSNPLPTFMSISWGVDSMDQLDRPLDGQYHCQSTTGNQVTIYIVDSGCGICETGTSTVDDNPRRDLFGHGTAVATIIRQLLPEAMLISVKVLNDHGLGNSDTLTRGLQWIAANAHAPYTNIINMSLGSHIRRDNVAAAIADLHSRGFAMVAASGNEHQSSGCRFWPAAFDGVVSTGAIKENGQLWEIGNHGDCVDVYAPGESILVNNHLVSGTSIAAPFATAALAFVNKSTTTVVQNSLPTVNLHDACFIGM